MGPLRAHTHPTLLKIIRRRRRLVKERLKPMRFRRNSSKRMFQSKQFVLSLDVADPGPSAGGFFKNDVILISADTVLGISNTVQGALKRIVVVGVDWYFDGLALKGIDTPATSILFNYVALYKDTLDSASVPDASPDSFLPVDQVSGTTNQQLFPERILDRRSFSVVWDTSTQTLCYWNPGMSAERRVRRPVALTSREALIFRLEAFLPPSNAGQQCEIQAQAYGVVTYRVDL